MLHLLIVEDNETLGATTKEYLELKGFHVERVKTGPEGLAQAQKMTYDCILLDVMLPGLDGFSVLKKLRETRSTPVLMLTARGEIGDKKEGFLGGADDYLVKPFDFEELERRIQALIKRTHTSDTIIRHDIQIMLDENEVKKGGEIIHLTQTEFIILALIMEEAGHTVSKTTLIEAVRGSDALWEHTNKLDVHIHNIRKKLHKEIIISVPGIGFKAGES